MSKINITVETNGQRYPFWIEPRTRVKKMKQVIEEVSGIEIDKLLHYENRITSDFTILSNLENFLIEDYGLSNGHLVVVEGKLTNNPNFENSKFINIYLEFNGIKSSLRITSTTMIKHIKDIIVDNMDIIPKSIVLEYNNKILNNLTMNLVNDLHIKENDVILIRGTYFPFSCLGKNFESFEKKRIYESDECIICYENIDKSKIFKCGHINVCESCLTKYKNDFCPLCKK